MWDFSLEVELNLFTTVVAQLGLEPLAPCRYAMRHGGVSHDLMAKIRSVADAMRRGRWRSDASLRRYAKETRILAELRKVDPRVLTLGALIEQQLPGLLAGTVLPPPVPDLRV